MVVVVDALDAPAFGAGCGGSRYVVAIGPAKSQAQVLPQVQRRTFSRLQGWRKRYCVRMAAVRDGVVLRAAPLGIDG